ncbi:hypothetical protein [Rhodococcoides fascians]|uniref:hypothetical protein n=1 Tax=Rhodococcoides fascians TaxID=1828 RepID=UPI000561EBAF|nr:hypothetical protein [Rhodococcus fascians]
MALIQHPEVERIVFDAPAEKVSEWVDAGWKSLSGEPAPETSTQPADPAPADTASPVDPPQPIEPLGSDKPTARTRKAD